MRKPISNAFASFLSTLVFYTGLLRVPLYFYKRCKNGDFEFYLKWFYTEMKLKPCILCIFLYAIVQKLGLSNIIYMFCRKSLMLIKVAYTVEAEMRSTLVFSPAKNGFKSVISSFCCIASVENISLHFQTLILPLIVIIQ